MSEILSQSQICYLRWMYRYYKEGMTLPAADKRIVGSLVRKSYVYMWENRYWLTHKGIVAAEAKDWR